MVRNLLVVNQRAAGETVYILRLDSVCVANRTVDDDDAHESMVLRLNWTVEQGYWGKLRAAERHGFDLPGVLHAYWVREAVARIVSPLCCYFLHREHDSDLLLQISLERASGLPTERGEIVLFAPCSLRMNYKQNCHNCLSWRRGLNWVSIAPTSYCPHWKDFGCQTLETGINSSPWNNLVMIHPYSHTFLVIKME